MDRGKKDSPPNKKERLLALSLLRTVRETLTSCRSSVS